MAQFTGYRTKDDLLADIKPYTSAKRVAHNTFDIQYVDGSRAIRYQDTDVVTWHKGHVILNSGGFKTSTTKNRMNEYMPKLQIYQHRSVWYVGRPGVWDMKKHLLYYDGMRFNVIDMALVSKPIDKEKHLARVDAMKKRIRKFVAKLDDGVPLPEAGDCWLCSFRDESGKTWGDMSKDDHILSHVIEGYMHGSLVFNALTESGCKPEFYLSMAHEGRDFCVQRCKRSLTNYLQKRLLP